MIGSVPARGVSASARYAAPLELLPFQDGSHAGAIEPRRLTAEGATSFSHIAAGDKHSAALVGGKLYTWGSGACGQLGHGQLPARGSEVPHLPRPTVVNYADAKQMPSFRSVACGAACTVVTTEDEVYLCGSVAPRASIVVPPGATASSRR